MEYHSMSTSPEVIQGYEVQHAGICEAQSSFVKAS